MKNEYPVQVQRFANETQKIKKKNKANNDKMPDSVTNCTSNYSSNQRRYASLLRCIHNRNRKYTLHESIADALTGVNASAPQP